MYKVILLAASLSTPILYACTPPNYDIAATPRPTNQLPVVPYYSDWQDLSLLVNISVDTSAKPTVDISLKNFDRAFQKALINGEISLAKQLLSEGKVNINYVDENGMSALMILADSCGFSSKSFVYNTEFCEFFKNFIKLAGLKIDSRNQAGLTALEIALSKYHEKAIEFILPYSKQNKAELITFLAKGALISANYGKSLALIKAYTT